MKNKIIFALCFLVINSNILAMDIHNTYKHFLNNINTFLQKEPAVKQDYQLLHNTQQNIINLMQTLGALPDEDNDLKSTVSSFLSIANFSLLDRTNEKIPFEKLITKVNEEVLQITTQPQTDIKTDIQAYLNQSVQRLDKKTSITLLQKIQTNLKEIDLSESASPGIKTLLAINILELEQDRTLYTFLSRVKFAISSLYFSKYQNQLCTFLKPMFTEKILSSPIGKDDIVTLLINLQKVVNARGLRSQASQASYKDYSNASTAIATIIKRVKRDEERSYIGNDTNLIMELCNDLFPQIIPLPTNIPTPGVPLSENPINPSDEIRQVPSSRIAALLSQIRSKFTGAPVSPIIHQEQQAENSPNSPLVSPVSPQPPQPESGWLRGIIQGVENWIKSIGDTISSLMNQIRNYFRPANK